MEYASVYLERERVILLWVHQLKLYILLCAMISTKLIVRPKNNSIYIIYIEFLKIECINVRWKKEIFKKHILINFVKCKGNHLDKLYFLYIFLLCQLKNQARYFIFFSYLLGAGVVWRISLELLSVHPLQSHQEDKEKYIWHLLSEIKELAAFTHRIL